MANGETRATAAPGMTTVGWEMLVAVSGIVLVLFIIAHLAGNLLVFLGPAALNTYSVHVHNLGPLLWLARAALLAAFIVHVLFTIRLFLANRAARREGYVARRYRDTNFMKLTMIYTGLIVFVFVFFHLYDFTFTGISKPVSVVRGQDLGLYGVLWNAFADPMHAFAYVVAVWAVGFHFTNAVSTFWVTLGLLNSEATDVANWVARILGAVIAVGFTAIPVYVLVRTYAGF